MLTNHSSLIFLSYSIDIYDKNIPYTIKFLAVRSELIGGQISC